MVHADCCCVDGCGTSKDVNRELSFHKLPQLIGEESLGKLLEEIGRKKNDPSFKQQKATICSLHFSDDCFITVGAGTANARRLKKNSWPTLNLPPRGNKAELTSVKDKPEVVLEKPLLPIIKVKPLSPDLQPAKVVSPSPSLHAAKAEPSSQSLPLVAEKDSLSRFSDEEILLELSKRQAAFVCACGMIFRDRALYYVHRSCHNPSQPCVCAFCGFKSSDWPTFHTHFFKHSNVSQKEIVEID